MPLYLIPVMIFLPILIGGAVGAVVGLVLRREPGRAGTIAAAAVINEIIAVIAAKEGFKLAGEIPPPQRA